MLNNKTYDIEYNIYNGDSYFNFLAYNYLVDKHLTTKRDIYKYDSVKKPQFFEIIYAPLKVDYDITNSNFIGDDEYFNKIVAYIKNTNVCFTFFCLNYALDYMETADEIFYIIDYPSYTATNRHGHAISILVYRNGNDIQVIFIDNEKITPPEHKQE